MLQQTIYTHLYYPPLATLERRPSYGPRRHYVFDLSAFLCVCAAPASGGILRPACLVSSQKSYWLLWSYFDKYTSY